MAKEDVVKAGVAAIQQGEIQLYSDQLGGAYDMGFTDGVASVPVSTPGTFTQGDIDAAVAAAQAVDLTALQASQADAADKLAALQGSLDALTAKEAPEASLIASLQQSAASLTAALAAINAALNPAPPAQ